MQGVVLELQARLMQRYLMHAPAPLQPDLVISLLLCAPPGLRELELRTACAGPVLPALARFTRLRTLHISGNGADIDWEADVGSSGHSAAFPALQRLALDYRQRPEWQLPYTRESVVYPSPVRTVPPSLPARLAAATRLHTMDLCVRWSADVAALCEALPALRHLRCAQTA